MQVQLQVIEGTSSKFWHIAVTGTEVTVRYGRIGTAGQTQVKSFATPREAEDHATKLVAEKRRKGCAEPPGDAA